MHNTTFIIQHNIIQIRSSFGVNGLIISLYLFKSFDKLLQILNIQNAGIETSNLKQIRSNLTARTRLIVRSHAGNSATVQQSVPGCYSTDAILQAAIGGSQKLN